MQCNACRMPISNITSLLKRAFDDTFFGLFQVRPIVFEDFDEALHQVRASVSEKDLDLYIEWNKLYGSGTK